MSLFSLLITIILSVCSTGIMSYISMATPIGPWIEPTIVLFATILFNAFYRNLVQYSQNIALVTVGASIGGILATALGFSFPTLFFLDEKIFNSWLVSPIYFSCVVTILSLSASLFGFWIANILENKFIYEQQLAFPIGQLVHKMISSQNQKEKAKILSLGFFITVLFCILQDGFYKIKGFIPKFLVISKNLKLSFIQIPTITFDLFPVYWAIGYIAGHIIAIPLLVGAISKIFVIDPINNLFFAKISSTGFLLAFCSGIVLSGAISGILSWPKLIYKYFSKLILIVKTKFGGGQSFGFISMDSNLLLLFFVLGTNFIFMTYFKFNIVLQIYLMFFTFVCSYQIIDIAGKIGLAQLGRFATFVMVPAIFIFNLNVIQITFIATFVEICAGVATDLLFGRKVAQLSSISLKEVKKYQLLGIVVSSVFVGIIFWFLINHFSLGSAELFAQRAQARALLVNAISFNHYVLLLGLIFGFILKKIKINPMLVLGGILMPLNISVGLIAGSICTRVMNNKEKWEPFWSGVFASHSIWMIFQAVR